MPNPEEFNRLAALLDDDDLGPYDDTGGITYAALAAFRESALIEASAGDKQSVSIDTLKAEIASLRPDAEKFQELKDRVEKMADELIGYATRTADDILKFQLEHPDIASLDLWEEGDEVDDREFQVRRGTIINMATHLDSLLSGFNKLFASKKPIFQLWLELYESQDNLSIKIVQVVTLVDGPMTLLTDFLSRTIDKRTPADIDRLVIFANAIKKVLSEGASAVEVVEESPSDYSFDTKLGADSGKSRQVELERLTAENDQLRRNAIIGEAIIIQIKARIDIYKEKVSNIIGQLKSGVFDSDSYNNAFQYFNSAIQPVISLYSNASLYDNVADQLRTMNHVNDELHRQQASFSSSGVNRDDIPDYCNQLRDLIS